MSLYALIPEYAVLAFLVIVISLYLSKYVDALDKKTNLSGAFIGGVMLAAVTSLPELFTSITAVLFLGEEQLVQGNVFGSNIFNLTIIAICVLMASKAYKTAPLSKTHKGTAIYTIIMFLICIFGMYANDIIGYVAPRLSNGGSTPYLIPLYFTKINVASLIIVILYIINLKTLKGDDSCENDEEDTVDLSVKQIVVRFVLLAITLVSVSILLTMVTDELSNKLNLGKTVGGAIFLGIATSLPELTSSINLVRLKNFNASFGNVLGSNLFNFTILCFGDLLFDGNIYNPNNESLNLTVFGIISTIIAILIIYSKKNRLLSILLSILLLASYLCSILFSV